jgi:hypothetical protein
MKRFGVLAATLSVVALFSAGAPANAETSAAACEPPPNAVQGYGNWAPPVTSVLQHHSFTMQLDADCPGTGHDAGRYHFTLQGESDENCTAGTGTVAVSGTDSDGDGLSGSMSFYKGGVHYYMSGSFNSDNHTHDLFLWLDVQPPVNVGDVCAYGNAFVFGHGAIHSESNK